MLIRYGYSSGGDIEKKARLYTISEHGLEPENLDSDALKVVKRLDDSGFEAYIVGGALRDLLVGRRPKDFDVATSARPRQIKKLFGNSRIIGRRFRLVHVYFDRNGEEKIIEVSTFRSPSAEGDNNSFGSLEEDARRRDFTINALFYCPIRRLIFDYVGGYQDLKAGRLKTLNPVEASFKEDPVRMIRGAKYAGLLSFRVSREIRSSILKLREEISSCSIDRVTEEVFKILVCGRAEAIIRCFMELKLLEIILPEIHRLLDSGNDRRLKKAFWESLSHLDRRCSRSSKGLSRGEILALLARECYERKHAQVWVDDPVAAASDFIRRLYRPLRISRQDQEEASRWLLEEG